VAPLFALVVGGALTPLILSAPGLASTAAPYLTGGLEGVAGLLLAFMALQST
jgi:hypothetical protein